MSDWLYVAGEGGFDQDFRIVDQETNEVINVSGATILKMYIVTTDREPGNADNDKNFPVGGQDMTPATNNDGESVARYAVQSNIMPQSADMYLCQIEAVIGGTFRTLIINLRVVRNLGS